MRLEWLEDILAVLETGSFIRAAERRLVTQPAFSRRIRQIEDHIGVELFDRSKKPVQLKKFVTDQQLTIRELVAGLNELRQELKRQDAETGNRIVIACQHALTTSIAPALVRKLSIMGNFNTRLRSANRDECYALLMTKQADLILVHQSDSELVPTQTGFLEQCNLGSERFVPVCATNELPRLKDEHANGEISVVAYPTDSFLGQVVNREIFSQMWGTTTIRRKAETALTLAALRLALVGVGVAWLPYSLAKPELCNGHLTDLSDMFPSCELNFMAIRMSDPKSPEKDTVWEAVSSITNKYPDD